MYVDVCNQVAPDAWQELVASDSTSTFFHTLDWVRLIEATVPGWSRLYVTAQDRKRIVGALPLMVRRVKGAVVLASMPFGTYGGVLIGQGVPNIVTEKLFRRFFELAHSPRVAYGELVDFYSRISPKAHDGPASLTIEAHLLDLTPGYEALCKHFTPSNRNKIRKAQQRGVHVRRATSMSDFLKYQSILADCCARWRSPLHLTPDFFQELSKLRRPHVEMWLADCNGDVVAGLLNFVHNGMVMNWGSVSLPSGRRTAANNILQAAAIEEAARSGASYYNFGSNPGLPGVRAFKMSFATRSVHYRAYRAEKLWYRILRGGART